MAPLNLLLEKEAQWWWTPEHPRHLRPSRRVSNILFVCIDHKERDTLFCRQTHAKTVCAMLYQKDLDGRPLVIAYASTRLNATEQKYHVNEQECLTVMWIIRKYRYYLEETHFILRTDSRALKWLRESRNNKAKLRRWGLLLSEFDFDIQHCPGKNDDFVDTLSRQPTFDKESKPDED
ncbi:hypothetical protein PR048_027753, partial [Dryococelus australis]